MKKLLVLMLVFGIASMATAGLQISVEGNPDPVDSEYTLLPSEELILDIHATGEGNAVYYALVADQAVATISGGMLVGDASLDMSGYLYMFAPYIGIEVPPMGGIMGNVTFLSGVIPDGAIVDGILFHCEGPDDALISLYSSLDSAGWQLEDTLIIHQIPEPITMALLGLGGLFLRRRK